MINGDARKIDHIVHETLRRTNNRGVVLSGWGEMQNQSSKSLLYFDAIPHQWLLPHCKIIIHHSGAGTTSAGLWAGIPNIVIPFAADQPFWGSRVSAIGAGPKPIPVKKLSVDNLTQAILGADDPLLKTHAQEIGQQLRRENGIGQAIKQIEKSSNEFIR